MHIIAIGSSAGGLAPLVKFFDHTHASHCSYFLLQHLPFQYTSDLTNILLRHSLMQVVFAEDGLTILPDHIYLIPTKHYIGLLNHRLCLIPRQNAHGPNMAFTVFLYSLVKDKTSRVTAIFLSGAGADGANMLPALKNLGATVLAQTLATCQFPEMAANAIATGHVNYILRVEDMPALIQTL